MNITGVEAASSLEFEDGVRLSQRIIFRMRAKNSQRKWTLLSRRASCEVARKRSRMPLRRTSEGLFIKEKLYRIIPWFILSKRRLVFHVMVAGKLGCRHSKPWQTRRGFTITPVTSITTPTKLSSEYLCTVYHSLKLGFKSPSAYIHFLMASIKWCCQICLRRTYHFLTYQATLIAPYFYMESFNTR